jgi:hypothetical protein
MQIDKQTDRMKLTFAVCNFVNSPKNDTMMEDVGRTLTVTFTHVACKPAHDNDCGPLPMKFALHVI